MICDSLLQNTLSLLAVSLDGTSPCEPPDMTLWADMKPELEAQAVLPLVSDYVLQAGISEEEQLDVMKQTAVNVRTFHKLMTAQEALTKLLDANRIPAAILKGAAAAQYYPDPALRQYGDIDLLVLPADYEKTFQLLVDSGYERRTELDNVCQRHTGFASPLGNEIELHRFFSDDPNKKWNALFDSWLYEKLGSTQQASIEKYTVPVLPPLENGLTLLGHMGHHLTTGLGLRQIIDWMMFVRAELNDEFWESAFRERAEALNMAQLAKTVTRMCQIYLGLSGDITWCADADDELVDELMLYILGSGNFGHKLEHTTQGKATTVLRHLLTPSELVRYLTEIGMIHMKEDGRKPRKSIAWLYQIGHLLSTLVKDGKRVNWSSGVKTASRDAEFFSRLGVTGL